MIFIYIVDKLEKEKNDFWLKILEKLLKDVAFRSYQEGVLWEKSE